MVEFDAGAESLCSLVPARRATSRLAAGSRGRPPRRPRRRGDGLGGYAFGARRRSAAGSGARQHSWCVRTATDGAPALGGGGS